MNRLLKYCFYSASFNIIRGKICSSVFSNIYFNETYFHNKPILNELNNELVNNSFNIRFVHDKY